MSCLWASVTRTWFPQQQRIRLQRIHRPLQFTATRERQKGGGGGKRGGKRKEKESRGEREGEGETGGRERTESKKGERRWERKRKRVKREMRRQTVDRGRGQRQTEVGDRERNIE